MFTSASAKLKINEAEDHKLQTEPPCWLPGLAGCLLDPVLHAAAQGRCHSCTLLEFHHQLPASTVAPWLCLHMGCKMFQSQGYRRQNANENRHTQGPAVIAPCLPPRLHPKECPAPQNGKAWRGRLPSPAAQTPHHSLTAPHFILGTRLLVILPLGPGNWNENQSHVS